MNMKFQTAYPSLYSCFPRVALHWRCPPRQTKALSGRKKKIWPRRSRFGKKKSVADRVRGMRSLSRTCCFARSDDEVTIIHTKTTPSSKIQREKRTQIQALWVFLVLSASLAPQLLLCETNKYTKQQSVTLHPK